jgi:hypothetical protein
MAVFLTVFFNIEFKKTSIYKVCRLFINGTYPKSKKPTVLRLWVFSIGGAVKPARRLLGPARPTRRALLKCVPAP